MDCCLCRAAEVSVFPMKMQTLVLGSMAPLVHHFRPLITNSSPSLTMEDSMLVASEEATAGSVMAKHDLRPTNQSTVSGGILTNERSPLYLISPSRSGLSQLAFCSSVPYLTRTSMFPVSGALQLNGSEA